MALIKPMFPITEISGTFSTSIFAMIPAGIDLQPTKGSKKKKYRVNGEPAKYINRVFKLADKIYQDMTEEARAGWRRALKRKCLSPYGLWMSECMICFHRHENAPSKPSRSGGYSTAHVVCDSAIPPPT